MQPHELQEIWDLFVDCRKKGRGLTESYEIVGKLVGRSTGVVGQVIQRLRPTTDMGKMYMRAKAYSMARRLVKKASPSELVDILSRPGIDVLARPAKTEDNTRTGFFLSVSADSCGAVKVGMASLPEPKQQLEAAPEEYDPFSDTRIIDTTIVEDSHGISEQRSDRRIDQRGAEGHTTLSPIEIAVARARKNLEIARRHTQHQENPGDQGL